MKKIAFLILMAFTFMFSFTAESAEKKKSSPATTNKNINGWGEAKWGMTESEILEAFKGRATKQDKRVSYGMDGDYANIAINKIEVGGRDSKVEFLMNKKNDKLKAVRIASKIDKSKTDYDNLQDLLITKYGEPSTKDKRSDAGITKSTWIFPQTKIELIYIEYPPLMDSELFIMFKEVNSETLENL